MNLFPSGFALVHVDLSAPSQQPKQIAPPLPAKNVTPPLPPLHNSLSTQEFHSSAAHPDLGRQKSSSPTITLFRKNSKASSDLERFFDGLGQTGSSNVSPGPSLLTVSNSIAPNGIRGDDKSESPVFFSSVSSVDSGHRRSAGSVDSGDSPADQYKSIGGARTVGTSILVQHGEPSIVERNARVIKWLFNCRKAWEKR